MCRRLARMGQQVAKRAHRRPGPATGRPTRAGLGWVVDSCPRRSGSRVFRDGREYRECMAAQPTPLHQRILALFHARPLMIVELLASAEPELRARLRERPWVARVEDPNLRMTGLEGENVEVPVDLVITLEAGADGAGPTKIAVVVECPLQPDPDKLYAWADCLAAVRSTHRCIGKVLVLSPIDEVFAWAHDLFEGEPGFRPALVGREQMPRIEDLDRALREPELAVLSAIFHGGHEAGAKVVSAAAEALRELPEPRRSEALGVLEDVLPEGTLQEIRRVILDRAQTDL